MIPLYFTGLPPGPEHDRVVALGHNYIVFDGLPGDYIREWGEGPFGFRDPGEPSSSVIIAAVPHEEWARVRALSLAEAIERLPQATDQCIARTNRSPHWQEVAGLPYGSQRDHVCDGGSLEQIPGLEGE